MSDPTGNVNQKAKKAATPSNTVKVLKDEQDAGHDENLFVAENNRSEKPATRRPAKPGNGEE